MSKLFRMVWLAVVLGQSGCSSPEGSMQKAREAIESHDIATFEEVVDLQSLTTSILHACMALQNVESTANDNVKKERTAGEMVGGLIVDAMIPKLAEKMVLDIRANFGAVDVGRLEGARGCGGVALTSFDAVKFDTAGKTSRASIPVMIGGAKPSTVALRIEEGERGWVIKALELGEALSAYEEYQRDRVRAEADAARAAVRAEAEAALARAEVFLKDNDCPKAMRELHRASEAPEVAPLAKPGLERCGGAGPRGSLDKATIRRVIKQHIDQIRYCYERELIKNSALSGKVSTHFTIAADGSVHSVYVMQTTLNHEGVENCIIGKIGKWRFPKPDGNGSVFVTYPFTFKTND